MLFNEYADILEDGDVYFLDEENIFQIILEEDQPNTQTPKGLDPNDNTATGEEKKEANQQNQNQGNNTNNEQAKNNGRRLLDWFKAQSQKFGSFANEQTEKLKNRYQDLKSKVDKMPNDYAGEEEIEMPSQAPDPAPRMNRTGEDPDKMETERKTFVEKTQAWREKQSNKRKTVVKGAAAILGGKWLLKQIFKTSGELEFNLKEGKFYASMGMGKSQQGASGNGFAMSLAVIIKNVFLALLVLIGGIFKVLKEYLVALGKIIATVFNTVGQAGKTLVTGQMPSK